MMSQSLYRLGHLSARRPWVVIGSWLVFAAVVVGAASTLGHKLEDSFRVPGLDSQQANDLVTAAGTGQAGLTAQIAVTPLDDSATFFDSPQARAALAEVQAGAAALPNVLSTSDPVGALTAGSDTAQRSDVVSPDGRVALIRVQYPELDALTAADLANLKAFGAQAADGSPLRIEMGGDLFFAFEQSAAGIGEAIGLLVAAGILFLAFGSLIATALPIGMAIFGLAVGISSMSLLAHLIDVPSWAPVLGSMVGLGVGIDYALFVVKRHRDHLARGMPVPESVGHAIATAGQPVVFAGGIVVVSVLGLAVAGVPFMTGGGIALAIVVAVMVAVSITLLPALLGLSGHAINRFGLRRHGPADDASWSRWVQHVTRHAKAYLVGVTALLLALAAPALALRAGIPDDGALPTSRTERQAYDLVAQGFGPGRNGPLVIAVDLAADPNVLGPLADAIGADRGIAEVATPTVNTAADVASMVAFPTTGPQDKATRDTVERLRSEVIPRALAGSPAHAHIGGQMGALRRCRRASQRSAISVHRCHPLIVVPPSHAGLPIGARATEGRRGQPAEHRGVVRRHGDGVSVGMGRGPYRPHLDRADRLVHPDVHVRDPLRPLHGLRGLPPHQSSGGVRRQQRQRRVGRPRHRQYRPGNHIGRAHHDRGFPRLRFRPGRGDEDVRPRAGHGHPRRHHPCAPGAGAGNNEASRRRQLVAPQWLDRLLPTIRTDSNEGPRAPRRRSAPPQESTPSAARGNLDPLDRLNSADEASRV